MDQKAAEILQFQIRNGFVSLYKRHLNAVEDLKEDHRAMIRKLEEALPPEYHQIIRSVDFFDDNRFSYLRKRVLDSGNEAVRNVEEQLKQFDIEFGPPR